MSFIRRTIIVPAILLTLLSSISLGRDIYVHGKRGDDNSTGHSVENTVHATGPMRTISRALERATPGDRIVIDPDGGPYHESISLVGPKKSGAFDMPFIIEGNGAVLDGRKKLPPGVWKHFRDDIYRFEAIIPSVDMSYLALFDGDKMLKRIPVAPDSKKLPALEPNSWCLRRGFVFFRTENDRSPLFGKDYDLSYSAKSVGISLIQVRDVRIHDLNVRGFQLDGIAAANGAVNVVLDNVTSKQNGRAGLAIGGASIVAAGYCTFEDNQTVQVLAQPFSKTRLFDCTVDETDMEKSDDAELLLETR